MLSVELSSRCSCYVFKQYFAVKRGKCFTDFSHFVLTTKTTQPRPQVFSVNVQKSATLAERLPSSVQDEKVLPNLVNNSCI